MNGSRVQLRTLGQKHGAFKPAYYYDQYETHLRSDPREVTTMLELGVHEGGSLRMWADYFPDARVFGVDAGSVAVDDPTGRIHVLQADQTDTTSIGAFLRANRVDTLDLIIDDCSHMGLFTKQSFWYLFDAFLRPGGYYAIEDWGVGYWETWADGAPLVEPDPQSEPSGVFGSHNHGIPGFVKQLIDQQQKMESIVFASAFVMVRKKTIETADAIARSVRMWDEERKFF